MEVMGRDGIYMVRIVFPYCSPSFHFLIPLFLFSSFSFLLSFCLLLFFFFIFSSLFLLLFFLIFVYCNFFEKKKITFDGFV